MPVLGVHPLADPQRLLGELVQGAPDGAGLVGGGVRGAQLAEDLGLADDHRVEPGGHREQVLHGRAGVVHVDVLGELGQRHPGVPRQHRGDVGQAAVEGVDDRVDLDPVARGQQHRLATRAARAAARRAAWGPRRRRPRRARAPRTGALRCDSPTTSTLIDTQPHRIRSRGGR